MSVGPPPVAVEDATEAEDADADTFEPLTDDELVRATLYDLRAAYRVLRARHGSAISHSLQGLKSQGRYTGGKPPYGMQVSEDGTTLEPCPKEQRTIAYVRELYAAGMPYLGIVKTIHRKGIRSREGNRFYSAQVKAMIHGGRNASTATPR